MLNIKTEQKETAYGIEVLFFWRDQLVPLITLRKNKNREEWERSEIGYAVVGGILTPEHANEISEAFKFAAEFAVNLDREN